MSRARLVGMAVGSALTLAGCGLGGSSGSGAPASVRSRAAASIGTQTASAAATIARTRVTHELPTPAPGPEVSGGWRSPAAAVRAFAATYVNWSARTVAARLRGLAAVSVGQARSAMERSAAEVADDRELHRGGIANSGLVEAIGPVVGRGRAYAVVTRERTTATASAAYRGLAPAWHVSVATVSRLPDGLWVICGWQPEN